MELYDSNLMKHKQAKLLLEGLGIKNDDFQNEALTVVNIYGSYKKALKAAANIEFKNGTQILYKLLESQEPYKSDFTKEAGELITIMHGIHSVLADESKKYNTTEADIINRINKKASFALSDVQLYVIDEIGGNDLILNITLKEPNLLEKKVISAFEKHRYYQEHSDNKYLESGKKFITS